MINLSCDGPVSLIENRGIVSISIPLKNEYDPVQVDFILFDSDTNTEYLHNMVINDSNSEATLSLLLDVGEYTGYIVQHKDWDDINGCVLYCQTDAENFTVSGNIEETLDFNNPWISNTQNVSFNIDVSTMIAEGITPDRVGIWMQLNRSSNLVQDTHYHFHATELNGNILSGSFPVHSGEYEIQVIPTNFDHPDWLDSEPWWYSELSAGNLQPTFTIATDTTDVNIMTTHYVEDGLSNNDAGLFLEYPNNGTLEFVGDALHMAGNGEDSVPVFQLIDDISIESNTLITFDFKLGARDDILNGTHPMLHVNMLTGGGPGDTRVFMTIDEDGLWLGSLYDGVITSQTSWNGGANYYNDGSFHTLSLFLRNGLVRVYDNLANAPILTYEYDNRLPETGGFSFECHQEIYIDSVRLEHEITGGLTL